MLKFRKTKRILCGHKLSQTLGSSLCRSSRSTKKPQGGEPRGFRVKRDKKHMLMSKDKVKGRERGVKLEGREARTPRTFLVSVGVFPMPRRGAGKDTFFLHECAGRRRVAARRQEI